MKYCLENPCIVQSDRTILLETHQAKYEEARDFLTRFAELVKSPEHIHTYRITPISLWNASATGISSSSIIEDLEKYSKYEIPQNIVQEIKDYMDRYGRLKLIKEGERLFLESEDSYLLEEIVHHKQIQPFIKARISQKKLEVHVGERGFLKQELIKVGFPVEDLAGYKEGDAVDIALREISSSGNFFQIREYQRKAIEIFHAKGTEKGGSGVVVLPCGAGKTIIGIGAMAKLGCETLILTTNTVALRQWIDEIRDKTTLASDLIGEYSGDIKEICPITVSTYQILTARKKKQEGFTHFGLFDKRNWGLIIYDEVHLLPAPVFRATALLQAKRRLGLTATLVREDGKESDVFSLVGPKKYDAPWKDLEKQGWIATAQCHEVRISLPDSLKMEYAIATSKEKFRIASENFEKDRIAKALISKHKEDNILVIGQYIRQLENLASSLDAPLITGKTAVKERLKLYKQFKEGKIKLLVVSKVANFAIDLPDANIAIQISGTFGSRQEEAQRLGRILRPKKNGSVAHFYSLVTKETKDQEFAENRQLFLTEQGYRYWIHNEKQICDICP
ncbi:MAG: helicase-associated domain-containing protein [Candidatus Brocadiae bacterium]|nr:helicase-associated domain-containing protein [Candidatus Brocadiia bacterium]